MKHFEVIPFKKEVGEETGQPNQKRWQNRQNNEQPGSKYEEVRRK
jgi:hypothetical protein